MSSIMPSNPSRLPRKEFRIEKLLKARDSLPTGIVSDKGEDLDDLEGGAAILLQRVEALHEKIDSLSLKGKTASEPVDDLDVRIEITRLVKEIGKTKVELAALRHPLAEEDDDKIVNATNELDAIVEATEIATTEILHSSEEINTYLERLRADSELDEEHRAVLDLIEAKVVGILEACNFQDITGQRINKVVNTMKFIEERVRAMIEVWGVDAFSELPIPQSDLEGDAALLEGPQLEHQGLTQDDIDAMFD